MSVCSRPHRNCRECGDVVIHQSNRGPHESSSAFGQFVHDKLRNEMYWLDVDGISYKKKTRMLRVIEHKPRHGNLSDGQKEVLPLLAKAIQILAATRLIHRDSGVFLVQSDHPHDVVFVSQIVGWGGSWSSRNQIEWSREMTGREWLDFLRGEVLDPWPRAA